MPFADDSTAHGGSYSSPQRVAIDGVVQILLLTGAGATSVAVTDGTPLWEYPWPGTTIVQPALLTDGNVLISSTAATGGIGTRRIVPAHGAVGRRWPPSGCRSQPTDQAMTEVDVLMTAGGSR